MDDTDQKKGTSALSQVASAAGAAKSAIKTGKAIAGITKGAAAGPYGLIAAGLWENRKLVLIVLVSLGFLFFLPILFILMLPSLIFGNNGLDDVPDNVLNDNTVIMENIAETETAIEEILREKHDTILEKIETEASSLGSNTEYSITDDFADRIIFESTLIISQFSASQTNYKEINLSKLKTILCEKADGIFNYSVSVTSREEYDEDTSESTTIYHYEYTVEYAGDTYYRDNVFELTDKQTETATQYASNLYTFLFDTVYLVEINPDLIPGETGNAAVDLALTKLGTPYSQELRDQEGYFDCSSFTYWVYSQLGVSLMYNGANTAAAQGRYIMENNLAISYDSLAPGDLIFYSFGVNNRYLNIGHVAIYAGDGYVVDASFSKKKVVYRPIYNTNNIVLCGRPYSN